MKLADLPKFPPTWRGSYPGMEAASRAVMTQWLDKHGGDVVAMYYNVRLYPDPTELPDLPADELAVWKELSALRVDAIATRATGNLLIEVSPQVTAATLGRMSLYWSRWPKTFPTDPLVDGVLVYSTPNPVIVNAVKADGFQVEQL